MSNLSICPNQIIILEKDELLPIHTKSVLYVPNGRVIPDGENFLKCYLNENEAVAVHSSDTRLFYKAINEEGVYLYINWRTYPYISAEDDNGSDIFFINEKAAENSRYKFSLRVGKFLSENNEKFYGKEKLLSYHTSSNSIDRKKLPVFHSNSDDYLVGIEVEKVDRLLVNEGDAWEILQKTGWSKERDGSLGENGYEMVSPILPLYNSNVIEKSCDSVLNLINGQSNDRCGGHITISHNNSTPEELLEKIKAIVPVIYSLYPQRLQNNYCKAKTFSSYSRYPEKYSAFYIKSRDVKGGQLEIRLFSRITGKNNLMWRIKLLQLLIKNCGNLNQISQKIGCQESELYKHFRLQYSHSDIADKLRLINKYAIDFKSHKNGISPSAKKRINNTMSLEVFQ